MLRNQKAPRNETGGLGREEIGREWQYCLRESAANYLAGGAGGRGSAPVIRFGEVPACYCDLIVERLFVIGFLGAAISR